MADFSPAKLQLVERIPTGLGWLYEPKLDGYRGLVSRDARGRPSVLSRNGKDLGRWFPELVALAECLAPESVVDGEIVSPIAGGVSFTALQRRLMTAASERSRTAADSPVAFVAFDVLHDHASDLRPLSLRKRRKRLTAIVEAAANPLLQLVTQVEDPQEAAAWLDDGLAMAGIEGVVAKRDEPYPRPTVRRWQKVRRLLTLDALVLGFVGEPESPRLVVGVERDGRRRTLGTTLPISREDARALRPFVPRAVPSERPVWSPFDSHRYDDWLALPLPLVAEIAYSHLDGDVLRHSARFLRWRFSSPPDERMLLKRISSMTNRSPSGRREKR